MTVRIGLMHRKIIFLIDGNVRDYLVPKQEKVLTYLQAMTVAVHTHKPEVREPVIVGFDEE